MTNFVHARLFQVGTVIAATLLAAGASSPLHATDRAGATVRGENQAAQPERPICVRVELTGTRVAPRICRTRVEWDRVGGVPTND